MSLNRSEIFARVSYFTHAGWQQAIVRHILAADFGEVAEWSKAALC
jgi:hypothetical protein